MFIAEIIILLVIDVIDILTAKKFPLIYDVNLKSSSYQQFCVLCLVNTALLLLYHNGWQTFGTISRSSKEATQDTRMTQNIKKNFCRMKPMNCVLGLLLNAVIMLFIDTQTSFLV